MMTWVELFKPEFLLHNAFVGSVLVGVFCPLIGVYFMLRRMVLLGVALPQISAAGIGFIFFLQSLGFYWTLHPGETDDRFLALIGSLLFTAAALSLFAYLDKRAKGTAENRLGASYVIASAVAILLVANNPNGKIELLEMLHGEVVSVNSADLNHLMVAYGIMAILLLFYHRQFLFTSFDPESARVMGKNVFVWDSLLFAMIGLSISMSVLIVGPMLTFACLMIPPIAARRFCRTMKQLFWLSSLLGGLGGLIGFYVSYRMDWPLGPTNICVLGLILVLSVGVKRLSLTFLYNDSHETQTQKIKS